MPRSVGALQEDTAPTTAQHGHLVRAGLPDCVGSPHSLLQTKIKSLEDQLTSLEDQLAVEKAWHTRCVVGRCCWWQRLLFGLGHTNKALFLCQTVGTMMHWRMQG